MLSRWGVCGLCFYLMTSRLGTTSSSMKELNHGSPPWFLGMMHSFSMKGLFGWKLKEFRTKPETIRPSKIFVRSGVKYYLLTNLILPIDLVFACALSHPILL